MPLPQIIRPGDRIKHPLYGVGTVQKMWRSGRELVAKVKWDSTRNQINQLFTKSEAFSIVLTPHIIVLRERSL